MVEQKDYRMVEEVKISRECLDHLYFRSLRKRYTSLTPYGDDVLPYGTYPTKTSILTMKMNRRTKESWREQN